MKLRCEVCGIRQTFQVIRQLLVSVVRTEQKRVTRRNRQRGLSALDAGLMLQRKCEAGGCMEATVSGARYLRKSNGA
jgi:hypothetical protein